MPDPGPGPIAQSMTALAAWLSTVDTAVWVGDPGAPDAPSGLCAWPIAVLPEQEVRATTVRQPMRLRVRYLLTAGGAADGGGGAGTDGGASTGAAELARLLDPVLLAAAGGGAVNVVFEPVPVELWRALDLRPRAALLVDVPAQVDRATPRPPLVRGPLRLDGAPVRSLRGQVVGPGDVPLAGVRVEATSIGVSTYTDDGGRFAFGGLPAGDPARLVLAGRGRQFQAEVSTDADAPVLIRCDFEEA
jgi:Carboxypeptidase regulatory-like domain